ncbi:hypothetical protein [Zooshikella sp. RANM57]|uniref:hypothetical protein n=1 Tax=Zooshikella sp. RANM57 TaxID=3425863 RepID=UPI003D6F96B0
MISPYSTCAKKINSHLNRFDILALLKLLDYKGYTTDKIRFKSNANLTSQKRIVERVEFIFEYVHITLNLGLLGTQTHLPSYWLKKLDHYTLDRPQLEALLILLDHMIILDFLGQLYPEINRYYFTQWHQIVQQHVFLDTTLSSMNLHWLLTHVFPEFDIILEQQPRVQSTQAKTHTFGMSTFNSTTTLGGIGFQTVSSLLIRLTLRYADYRHNLNWENEINYRLRHYVLVFFTNKSVNFDIVFTTSIPREGLRLQLQSQLGQDTLIGMDNRTKHIHLYEGQMVDAKPKPATQYGWTDLCRIQL